MDNALPPAHFAIPPTAFGACLVNKGGTNFIAADIIPVPTVNELKSVPEKIVDAINGILSNPHKKTEMITINSTVKLKALLVPAIANTTLSSASINPANMIGHEAT